MRVPGSRLLHAVLAAALLTTLSAAAQDPAPEQPAPTKPGEPYEPRSGQAGKDVMWVPTPDEVVEKMLDVVQVQPGDRLIDLGSGDGKIVIRAAKRFANAKGIEYNPDMVAFSKTMAQKAGVDVELVQGDIFASDFSNADVVTMYLLPYLNMRLRPTLLAMRPGTRVVSHSFHMGEWKADEHVEAANRDVYFWRVPANIEGSWRFTVGNGPGPTVKIRQRFQEIEGEALWGNRASPLTEATVRGARVTFVLSDPWGNMHRFEGMSGHQGPMIGVAAPYAGGAERLFVGTRE